MLSQTNRYTRRAIQCIYKVSFDRSIFYLSTVYFHLFSQVCADIDECLGPPENGGCAANSHCHNTMVTSPGLVSGYYSPVSVSVSDSVLSSPGLLPLWRV